MAEYRIDDLARAAGTTSRNVRSYQERGLLAPPEKRGRVGIYGDDHLARLKLIDSLLQRGFTIAHIGDFISGWERGQDLTELLGLQHAVTQPWSKEQVVELPVAAVRELLGPEAEQLDRIVALGFARIEGETCIVTDLELFESFSRLLEHGFTARQLIDIHERIHHSIGALSRDLIGSAIEHIVGRHAEGWLPTGAEVRRTTELLYTMRELGVAAVHSALARTLDDNLERELGDYLAVAINNTRPDGDTPDGKRPDANR